ncbi:hypothetical protein EC973_007163 [Apophysomyces ossiformis]|uniref:Uncharacterized protein n=1 Tax=Apophysomyces ossiformis TaxID=679940 RepID=A0A8H7BZD9_9FUNG|nr:hypothetical protein EC973_007163 [Apophysomyces ossiformis]
MTPVNLEAAEKIISHLNEKSCKKSYDIDQIIYLLNGIQVTVSRRRCYIRHFLLTTDALKHRYECKIEDTRREIEYFEEFIQDVEEKAADLCQREIRLQKANGLYHHHLRSLRLVAEWCRQKKQKRDSQYAFFSLIPLLSFYYKKKYIRARNKNAQIEQKLSEIQHKLAVYRPALRRLADMRKRYTINMEEARYEREKLALTLTNTEKLLQFLVLGQQFWSHFDSHQAAYVVQDAVKLTEMIQLKQPENEELNKVALSFKLACLEYEEKEAQADELWGSLQVDFECAQCHISCHSWPQTDTTSSTELLCDPCFQRLQARPPEPAIQGSSRLFHQLSKWKKAMLHSTSRLSTAFISLNV